MENTDKNREFAGLPELLAPAGSFMHLKAAVLAGADAVYIGGRSFSARAYADNLGSDEIKDALHFTHFHGRRLYLTVNTLMKDEELNQELYGFLQPYYEAGLDGVIVQDLGTASFIHRNFPGMEVHASTQMTITHAQGAIAAGRLGMTRVVPARELSLDELITIKKESGLEVEVFIHGALCYCYSGQCLLSSFYGGRSGNRGQCAQPCRLPYQLADEDKASWLSLRDLCSLKSLPALVDAGIDSLKIEGRMKNVDYVAGVTAIYRKYLDFYDELRRAGHAEDYKVSPRDLHDLEELYCRGGFTEGYLNNYNGPSMMAVRTQKNLGRKIGQIKKVDLRRRRIDIRLLDSLNPRDILVIPGRKDQETILTVPQGISQDKRISLNIPEGCILKEGMPVYRRRNEALSARIKEEILDSSIKYPVDVSVNIRKERPAQLSLTSRDISITIEGPLSSQAISRELSKADIEKQFKKTGETPFILAGLTVNLDDGTFMPLSALKQLRQEGYRELEMQIAMQKDREKDSPAALAEGHQATSSYPVHRDIIALVYDEEVLSECIASDFYSAICLPADSLTKGQLARFNRTILDRGKKALLSLPGIMRKGKDDFLSLCKDLSWDGIYVHNINEAAWLAGLSDFGGERIASASFYQWNKESLETSIREFGIDSFQLPTELGPSDWEGLLRRGASPELVAYGHQTLMISAGCIKKTTGRCDHQSGILSIKDPKGRRLPVSCHCSYCYNRIWSHEAVDRTRDLPGELLKDIPRFTFDYFQTDKESVRRLTNRFAGLLHHGLEDSD